MLRRLVTVVCLLVVGGCAVPATPAPPGGVEVAFWIHLPNPPLSRVDLLFVLDDSASMETNQANFLAQVGSLIGGLVSQPCVSVANPTPHACVATDPSDFQQYRPLHDLHVGVISADLGTAGNAVPGCTNPSVGDDALLDPIARGGALRSHEPGATLPASYGRPADCADPTTFPPFLDFTSARTDADVASLTHDALCTAGVGAEGCAIQAPLEAVYRALVTHGSAPLGDGLNGGFVRRDALLMIVAITDKDDASVRNCAYANGDPCTDATDVYNVDSPRWSSAELTMRFHDYPRPGDVTDPTWPLERYVDPNRPTHGWLAAKPGHPEMIEFVAITGMPLDPPTTGTDGSAALDWDQLLGPPGPLGPDDFAGRQSALALTAMSAEGPVSMQLADPDPECPSLRTVPACRRRGSVHTGGSCHDAQPFAWPARRMLEIARRFDQSPLCNGGPCRHGFAASICELDDSAIVGAIAVYLHRQTSPFDELCFPRHLAFEPTLQGNALVDLVSCVVMEQLPLGAPDVCDPAMGLSDPTDPATGRPVMTHDAQTGLRLCEVHQVALDPATHRPIDPTTPGWFYSDQPAYCPVGVTYQGGANPPYGSEEHIACTQALNQ